jgi:putative DNA primase/helicase
MNKDIPLGTETYDNGKIDYVALAKRILSEHTFVTMSDDQSLWCYDASRGYYVPGEAKLKEICASSRIISKVSSFNNIRLTIEGLTQIDKTKFGNQKGFLNLINGVLNLKTKKLEKHSPEHKFLNRFEIKYSPKAKCPMFNKLLDTMGIDKKLVSIWFAYHFVPRNPQKKALFIDGVHDSGKSTLCDVLGKFVGTYNTTYFQLRDYSNNNTHAIVELSGKLANIHADLSYDMIKDISAFKAITGNDGLTSRMCFKENISFCPDVKLTFASNKLPQLSEIIWNHEPFWERVIVVSLLNSIPKTKRIGGFSEKIIKKELSGILNFALKGYNKALPEQSIIDKKKLWVASSMRN